MPADDYTAAVSGGLKLKNVSSSSKVSKSRKNKRPNPFKTESSVDANAEKAKDEAKDDGESVKNRQDDSAVDEEKQAVKNDGAASPPRALKTEAELRHEERRRKRLDERLKREGTKTHKERVEELNRYLSNLSEHHDMPRIGPGAVPGEDSEATQ